MKNGKWKEFNKHAIMIAEGNYLNDKKHGVWREYFDTGELMIEENFCVGVSHGRYTAFYKSGKILSEGKFTNGSREGAFKIYDQEGNHIKSLLFADNTLIAEVEGAQPSDPPTFVEKSCPYLQLRKTTF
jgi:antitoxin component YwqK of YwqJK toxin-antitoxin module